MNQFLIRAHLCKAILIADVENTLTSNMTEVSLLANHYVITKCFECTGKTIAMSGAHFKRRVHCIKIRMVSH